MRGRNRRQGTGRAFSLLEVLLVVVILGILAAFVVPSLIARGDEARIKATQAMVGKSGSLGLALDLYRQNMGEYPENLKDLFEPPSDQDKLKKWGKKYIEDMGSLKDSWGKDLQYKRPGEHNQDAYDLWSPGQDGQDQTDDDIGNWETKR